MEFLCINLHKLPYVAFLFIIPVPLERLWVLELVWPLVELVWLVSASLEEEGEVYLPFPYP